MFLQSSCKFGVLGFLGFGGLGFGWLWWGLGIGWRIGAMSGGGHDVSVWSIAGLGHPTRQQGSR